MDFTELYELYLNERSRFIRRVVELVILFFMLKGEGYTGEIISFIRSNFEDFNNYYIKYRSKARYIIRVILEELVDEGLLSKKLCVISKDNIAITTYLWIVTEKFKGYFENRVN